MTFTTVITTINRYIFPLLFGFGVLGSLLNIWLFSRPRLRSNSCCTYFFVSSIATMILLSMGIVPLMISTATSVNPFTSNNSFCKIRVYINQFSAMSCRWLLVMACLDRCCSSSANANLRRLSTVYVARRVSFGICLGWLILPFHTLIFVNLLERKTVVCVVTDSQVRIYHGLYTIIMGGILPPSIMFICSVFIWKNLRERAIRRNFLCPRRHAEYRDDQVVLMLLTQVLIFIISTVPFLSNNLYEALTRDVTNKSAERLALERFLAVLTELFVYIFPASLFYSKSFDVNIEINDEQYRLFWQIPIDSPLTYKETVDGLFHHADKQHHYHS